MHPSPSSSLSRFSLRCYASFQSVARTTKTESLRSKLVTSKPDLALPTDFATAVAKITEGFSFAYLQETFVSALLSLARSASSTATSPTPSSNLSSSATGELESNPVWQAVKTQVETPKKEMKDSRKSVEDAERNSIANDPKTGSHSSAGFGVGR